MGRARGHQHSVAATDRFDSLLGGRRGERPQDRLDATEPTSAGREQLSALVAEVGRGELDRALGVLHRSRTVLRQRPLLTELLDAVSGRLADEQLLHEPSAERFRRFFWLCGVRTELAERFASVLGEPGTHILVEDSERILTACGRDLTGESLHRAMHRGAWQRPQHKLLRPDGSSSFWNITRCEDCEPHAAVEPECAELPGSYPIADPQTLERLRALASAASRERLLASKAFSGAREPTAKQARTAAGSATEAAAVEMAAGVLAGMDDNGLRHAIGESAYDGYTQALQEATGNPAAQLTLTEEQWQLALRLLRPTATNADRFHSGTSVRMTLQLDIARRALAPWGYAPELDGGIRRQADSPAL